MRILITGANRGLGYELAAAACARGHHVLAGVRSPASGARLEVLLERYSQQLTLVQLDVSDEQSVSEAYRLVRQGDAEDSGRVGGMSNQGQPVRQPSSELQTQTSSQPSYAEQSNSEHPAIDAIINSAAILLGREQKLEELDFEQVERSMKTNLYGPMLVMKYFLPLLRRGERQCVINISSEAGSFTNAYGGDYSYALSKSALNMFTAQLRSQLAPANMTVYAVHPGWIRTDMGGSQAPGDAAEAANGIIDLVERRTVPEAEALFIDHRGRALSL